MSQSLVTSPATATFFLPTRKQRIELLQTCSWLSLTNESMTNHKRGALAMLHNVSLTSSSSQERIRDLYGWKGSQKIT